MEQKQNFLSSPVAILIGAVIISAAILVSNGVLPIKIGTTKQDVKGVVATPSIQPTQAVPQGPLTVTPTNPKIKTFLQKKDAQILKENGKPVIYLFSTTWCPHCQWISETFDKVVKEYVDSGKIKAYHWEIDINDNTLTAEKETKVPDKDLAIYQEFNPQGSIPTFVFGGKYFRTGNGYEAQKDLVSEEAEFKVVIDDLLNSN